MQSPKSRSWDSLTLGQIIRKIAGENELDPGYLEQTDESDASFLARLARSFSGAVKITAGRLAFIERGASKTASGSTLPVITLTRADLTRWSWVIAARGSYKSVVAKYRDLDAAETAEVVAGEGEPAFRLPHTYSSDSNARRAATAKLQDLARTSGGQIQLTMPGRLDIIAESPLLLTGISQGIDGQYVARRVTHTVTDGGFTSAVDFERLFP